MKNQETYNKIFDKLQPYRAFLLEDYEKVKAKYEKLTSIDHDPIGKVLKCHLILENYLNEYLLNKHSIDINQANLSFYQKVSIIPTNDLNVIFIREGLFEVNSIRNKFGHNLEFEVDNSKTDCIYGVLAIARVEKEYTSIIDAIEDFTAVCSAFLSYNPLVEKIIRGEFSKDKDHR